jgi:gamma-glutamylputrescine oxidase
MLSYWEQNSFMTYHHIVAGAGILGLSVAIELRERFPDQSVLILERGLLPTGASTRNAGFACMGSVTELIYDLNTMKESEVVDLFAWRKRGLDLLRSRLGDTALGYAERGSFELLAQLDISALEQIDYLNTLLKDLTEKPAFRIAKQTASSFGFNSLSVAAVIENTCEGELNSGQMMRALTDMAIMLGVEIKTGAHINKFIEASDKVEVLVVDNYRQNELVLSAQTLTICTNAFAKELLPDEDVRPGRGQVLLTEPIPNLSFKGIFHFDKGYYYFREIDGRVLLGGGRNLDFEGEATTEMNLSARIQKDLEEKLTQLILPNVPFTIAQRWSGIMAFGPTKFPIVKSFTHRVYGAFRMGGMGVALGSEAARRAVELLAEAHG